MNARTLMSLFLLAFLPTPARAVTAPANPASISPTASTRIQVTGPVREMLASLLVGQDTRGQETLTPMADRTRPRPGDRLAWNATAPNDLGDGELNLAAADAGRPFAGHSRTPHPGALSRHAP